MGDRKRSWSGTHGQDLLHPVPSSGGADSDRGHKVDIVHMTWLTVDPAASHVVYLFFHNFKGFKDKKCTPKGEVSLLLVACT